MDVKADCKDDLPPLRVCSMKRGRFSYSFEVIGILLPYPLAPRRYPRSG